MKIIKIGKNLIEIEVEIDKYVEERRNHMLEILKNPIKCMTCETVLKADQEDLIMVGDGYGYYEEYVKCPNCDNHITYSDII